MGDFNVNTLNELKNTSTHMHDFSNIFYTYYYHKLINLPTRECKQSSTLLDNIYTNIPDCYDNVHQESYDFFLHNQTII